jgi:G3E family GTPase
MTEAHGARAPKPPIPITVVTGFLGAGKTSLINTLVRDPALAGTGFIINEFGEIGIDHLLVAAADEDGIVELTSGCLCCTVRGELVTALENYLRGLDNGRIDRLTRVVIETTGLADPAPVLQTVLAHPYLSIRYQLDGVVAVVDAVAGSSTLDAHEEAVKQAAMADRIVVSKTDLPEGRTRAPALRARLRALNPGARLLDGGAGEASAAALLDCGLFDAAKSPDVARWLNEAAYEIAEDGHHHGHDHDHHHDHGDDHDCQGETCDHPSHHHHRHDPDAPDARIRSFVLTAAAAVPAGALEMFLELLTANFGASLLRLKGIVRLADDPARPLVVQGVQGVFYPPVRLTRWPDEDHRTRLVGIARDLDPDVVRRLFGAFAGSIGVDAPDRAGLVDNPLSLGGFVPPSQRR